MPCFKLRNKRKLFVLLCIVGLVCSLAALYSNDILIYFDSDAVENFDFHRDLFAQEPWPEMGRNVVNISRGHSLTLHYLWCGKKVFRFQHYLSLLSAIRVLKPQKIVFHYYHEPFYDSSWYHTWFIELKQSVPYFVLRFNRESISCGSMSTWHMALKIISQNDGGIYIGERTIVSGFTKDLLTPDFISFGTAPYSSTANKYDVTQGLLISQKRFSLSELLQKLQNETRPTCQNIEASAVSYMIRNTSFSFSWPCLVLSGDIYPKDIWGLDNGFGELSRWLFYGHRRLLQPQPDPVELIPSIAHLVWLKSGKFFGSDDFQFLHYLSVVSAIYVAGLERVYVHGEQAPSGYWWERAQRHNVTFVKTDRPETVFQQEVKRPAHQSDVLRINILLRSGGVYQDRDVIWVSKLPKDIRRYPAVVGADWSKNGDWPAIFNLGVLMAKPGAVWLKHFWKTFIYYRDDMSVFNAAMMPYRVYELYPDTLYLDKHLQVICFKGICHPGWQQDYIREIDDPRPVDPFDWKLARTFHFTKPKPAPELASPQALRRGEGMLSEIGQMILEKSGDQHLLNG